MKTENAKHTEGPWHYTSGVNAGSFCIWQMGEMNRIAKVQMGANKTDSYPYSETEANARLIAAAPELLEIVKLLIFPKDTTFMAVVAKATSIISKAEGRR